MVAVAVGGSAVEVGAVVAGAVVAGAVVGAMSVGETSASGSCAIGAPVAVELYEPIEIAANPIKIAPPAIKIPS